MGSTPKKSSPADSLCARLNAVHLEATRLFPHPHYDAGIGSVGIILRDKWAWCGYHNTPRNTRCFAGTGGDGVHFSFLEIDGRADEDCPVVITIPAGMENNFIVGENLQNFLCLGCRRGYFALEQLGYDGERTLGIYAAKNWEPEKKSDESVGLVPDERDQNILGLMRQTRPDALGQHGAPF